MSSPTGEVKEVIADVKKLVDDDSVMSKSNLTKIMQDYNTEQMVSANDPDGVPVLVSTYGQVAESEFVDAATGRVLTFNHLTKEFTGVTDQKHVLSNDIKEIRDATASAVDEYVEGNYGSNKCTPAVYGNDNGNVTVCLAATNVHLSNFWTGNWRSVYTANVTSEGKNELKGSIKVHVHYFEDGNVQLHTTIEKKAPIDCGSAQETGKNIANAIAKIEDEFQAQLEEMYVNMHRTTFKAMRRVLPISRKPMTWSSAAHSLASEVNKSA
jgi:capping protein alpha